MPRQIFCRKSATLALQQAIVIGLGLAVTQGGLSTKPLRDGTRACLRRAMPLSGAHKRLSVDNPPRDKSLSAQRRDPPLLLFPTCRVKKKKEGPQKQLVHLDGFSLIIVYHIILYVFDSAYGHINSLLSCELNCHGNAFDV